MSEVTERAARCQRLLNDSDLQQAFQDVRDAIHQLFEQASDDAATLVGLKHRLQVLDSVKANLEQAISDGELEQYREEQDKVVSLKGR